MCFLGLSSIFRWFSSYCLSSPQVWDKRYTMRWVFSCISQTLNYNSYCWNSCISPKLQYRVLSFISRIFVALGSTPAHFLSVNWVSWKSLVLASQSILSTWVLCWWLCASCRSSVRVSKCCMQSHHTTSIYSTLVFCYKLRVSYTIIQPIEITLNVHSSLVWIIVDGGMWRSTCSASSGLTSNISS